MPWNYFDSLDSAWRRLLAHVLRTKEKVNRRLYTGSKKSMQSQKRASFSLHYIKTKEMAITLKLDVGSASVNELGRMLRDHTDLILSHQLLDGHTSERSIDVQSLRENRRGNELVLRSFFVQLLVRVLIKKNKVIRLLLDLFWGTNIIMVNNGG